jgi:hypothetical protein
VLQESEDVVVKLAANAMFATGKQLKPAVTVYVGGVKAKTNTYKVTYGTNVSGTGTVTVTLTSKATYTFDGETSTTKEFDILSSDALVLTLKDVSVNYGAFGAIPTTKGTVKFNGKTVKIKDVTFTWGLTGEEDAGVYLVDVTGTYGDVSATTQIMVTVKASKVSVKTVKLDSLTIAEATDLEKDDFAALIEEKIIAAGYLEDGDFDVTVNELPSMAKKGTKSIKYTITLNNENLTFTSGKSVSTKSFKASVKVG